MKTQFGHTCSAQPRPELTSRHSNMAASTPPRCWKWASCATRRGGNLLSMGLALGSMTSYRTNRSVFPHHRLDKSKQFPFLWTSTSLEIDLRVHRINTKKCGQLSWIQRFYVVRFVTPDYETFLVAHVYRVRHFA